MDYAYDLVVIGAGSGGLAAAKRAASLGKKVAIAEKSELGGTCINRGCVPTKLMVYAAEFAQQQDLAEDYGWINPLGLFDWPAFKQAMERHIQTLRDIQSERLDDVEILQGQARFIDAHTLDIDGQTVTTRYSLIAVGARPRMPDIDGIHHALTSRDIFQLEALPSSLVIVGGGYIGVEFSQVFQGFGCRVTLIDSSPKVLNGFDQEIRTRVTKTLEADGVTIIDCARLTLIEKGSGTLITHLDNGQALKSDHVLCALGRTANIDTLNLDVTAVIQKKNSIAVDTYGQTQEPSIFAVGDCTDRVLLTPVAKAEAELAVDRMFSDRTRSLDYQWVPSAIFMHPEVATVGLTEQDARERLDHVEVKCSTFSPLQYAFSSDSPLSMIKIVADAKSDRIVGLHLIAPQAANLVQALVPALKKGLTVTELEQTIGIHPSVGEELFAL